MRKVLCLLIFLGFMPLQPVLVLGFEGVGAKSASQLRLYPVSDFLFVYQYPHPDHPTENEYKKLRLKLARTDWGYTLPSEKPGNPTVKVTLHDIEAQKRAFVSAGVLQRIIDKSIEKLRKRGLMGVYIMPHPQDIAPEDGADIRELHNSFLRFQVYTASVDNVETVARGGRLEGDEPVNHPAHTWIRKNSPLQPLENKVTGGDDLINQQQAESYLAYLNRHPGRHVGMSVVRPAGGKASLRYKVTESKPWVAFSQLTNNGTENTSPTQQRLGLIHNQFLGRDDILSLDFTTAGFEDFYSVQASYDAPWAWDQSNRTRLALTGAASGFTSTDVGLPGADFTGDNLSAGVQVKHTIFQRKDWFWDGFLGLDWRQIEVNNELAGVRGNEQFLKPNAGILLERDDRLWSSSGTASLETNLPDVAGTDPNGLSALGRTTTEDRWWKLVGSMRHSFFLEPLIHGQDFHNPETPESSTLAHEVRFNARGQYTFDDTRLIAQEKFIVGGMNSVRGYPQSVSSGDSGFMGSLEYRFHLPRVLPIDPDAQVELFGDNFKLQPGQVYGFPDWDLVFKVFSDYGRTYDNQNVAGLEFDEELWSVGAGVELQLSRNLRFQLDWGRAMLDLDSGRASEGDNEVHLSLTLLY
mgnify:CR=1 FL=1